MSNYIITSNMISARLGQGKKKPVEQYLLLMQEKPNFWGIAKYVTDKDGKETQSLTWVELTEENLTATDFSNPRIAYPEYAEHFNRLLSQATEGTAKYCIEHLSSFFSPEVLKHFSIQLKGVDLTEIIDIQMEDVKNQLGLSVEAKALKKLNMMSENTLNALGGKLPPIIDNPPMKTVNAEEEPPKENTEEPNKPKK